MRLSMYILADYLKQYDPVVSIREGSRQIRNVRPFSENHTFASSNVYVSSLGENAGGGVMCVNDNDFIFLPHTEVDEAINSIMDAFDFYNSWSDDLSRNLADYSLKDLIAKSRDVIPKFLIVTDSSYYALAVSDLQEEVRQDSFLKEMNENGILNMDTIMKIEKNPLIRQDNHRTYLQMEEYFERPPLTRNLFSSGKHLGWLLAIGDSYTRGEYDLLDELGDNIERWSALHPDPDMSADVSEAFMELLRGTVADKNRLHNRLKFAGLRLNDEKVVYITDLGRDITGYAILHRLNESAAGTSNFIFDDRLVTVLNGPEKARTAFEARMEQFLQKTRGRCGRSPVFHDVFQLREMYELADSSCAHSDAGRIGYFEDLSLHFITDVLKKQPVQYLIHPALPQLREYDRKNATQLYHTLKVYLLHERNIADTAKDLFIHRNSLLYRIRRIGEITNTDLEDPDNRLRLLLSFKLEGVQP